MPEGFGQHVEKPSDKETGMIEVKQVSKKFHLSRKQRREMHIKDLQNMIWAVSDVSFLCRPGRIFTLVGPNGAGKTTALRMIATMLKPTSGSIAVCGFDTVKNPTEVRKKIGFLTGNTGLYPRLTPEELVRYYASLYHMEKNAFNQRKTELFGLLQIHDFAKRRIGKLSTGMKQKVSIARTMIHDPEVVVFDEPTVGLDVITARNIIQLIRNCRDSGKTVIFSTHIMGEVNLLSDDLAIIHQGKLLYNDTYENFTAQMTQKSLEDEFIKMVESASGAREEK
jgi:sodium transport system ATP-binding protein